MSKAHEEGGDWTSSEHLASAFLSLGIAGAAAAENAEATAGEDEIGTINGAENEPATYEAALRSSQAREWEEAMRQEWQVLLENHTFDAVQGTHTFGADRDQVRRHTEGSGEPIGCKWVYRRKINPDGSTRYKAGLVIKGYAQKEGIDYDETYAPVSKMTTVRLLLALSAQHGWNVDHMDVVTAFLNPKIDRNNIHMATPPGIEWLEPCMPDGRVLLLRKALYGLKQAPRLWFEDINGYLQSLGFRQSAEDPNLYLQPGVLLILYVDDLLIAYDGRKGKGREIKRLLQAKYKMCDLGAAKRFLGIEKIERGEDGSISICQWAYIDTILKRFGQQDGKSAKTPLDHQVDIANTDCEDKIANRKEYLSIVGSLMYAALGSRPDIAFSVTALSRYNVQTLQMHLTAAKRVLRYLKTTS